MNQHGLARNIPTDVKLSVRQSCGFTCVICGRIPYTYEHFDPPFKYAHVHDPSGMALLCGNCQLDKTAGRISADQIRIARDKPYAGATWSRTSSANTPVIRLGKFVVRPASKYPISIAVNETPLMAFLPPNENGEPWRMSAALTTGDSVILIRRDELLVTSGAWDIRFEGKTLTVRSGDGKVDARVIFDPEDNSVSVAKLAMPLSNYWRIDADLENVVVSNEKSKDSMQLGGLEIQTDGGGMSVGLKHDPRPHPHTICFHFEHYGNWADWTGRDQSEVESFSDWVGQ